MATAGGPPGPRPTIEIVPNPIPDLIEAVETRLVVYLVDGKPGMQVTLQVAGIKTDVNGENGSATVVSTLDATRKIPKAEFVLTPEEDGEADIVILSPNLEFDDVTVKTEAPNRATGATISPPAPQMPLPAPSGSAKKPRNIARALGFPAAAIGVALLVLFGAVKIPSWKTAAPADTDLASADAAKPPEAPKETDVAATTTAENETPPVAPTPKPDEANAPAADGTADATPPSDAGAEPGTDGYEGLGLQDDAPAPAPSAPVAPEPEPTKPPEPQPVAPEAPATPPADVHCGADLGFHLLNGTWTIDCSDKSIRYCRNAKMSGGKIEFGICSPH